MALKLTPEEMERLIQVNKEYDEREAVERDEVAQRRLEKEQAEQAEFEAEL